MSTGLWDLEPVFPILYSRYNSVKVVCTPAVVLSYINQWQLAGENTLVVYKPADQLSVGVTCQLIQG